MTVLELMERVGSTETKLCVSYIKDAVEEIGLLSDQGLKDNKISIVKDTYKYDLSSISGLSRLESVSILEKVDDSSSQYRKIRRVGRDFDVVEDN
mgnify:CR=1 FL=1|tara:strand:- start:772 stop:1056 length:285 start_codon:yes stop_codon:yes gene_type:complete